MKEKKEHIIEELKELEATFLMEHKRSTEDIPKNYFENLSTNILTQTNSPKRSIQRYLAPLSIAAAVLLLLSVVYFTPQKTDTATWASIDKTEIENYINKNIEDFSDDEIASISELEDFSVLFSSSLSDDEMIDFLLEDEVEGNELF